jgi:hypothetical protein
MTGLLFETAERGGTVWRLEVVHHNGRTFANWRKWWRDGAGQWKPTLQGGTFPPERLSDLRRNIEAWEAGDALSGPENAS